MAKVMVVDDAYSELKLMESILRNAGHQVVSLIDGVRTIADLARDGASSEMGAYQIVYALATLGLVRLDRAVVTLPSSKNQESDKAWGKRQGADDYLPKPFTSDQLLTMVGRFVR